MSIETAAATVIVGKVPAKFFGDHYERCAESQPVCHPLSWGTRLVTVSGTPEQWANLRSDAEYYAFDSDFGPLRASAKATLKRLP